MNLSSAVFGLAGLAFEFFPHELLEHFDVSTAGASTLLMQIIGALYIGFAMMNWMARGIKIGGIYARPLAIGNLVHFVVAGLAIIKFGYAEAASPVVWIAAVIYIIFAVWFGMVAFAGPKPTRASE